MTNWRTRRIDQLGKVVTGKTPSSERLEEFGDKYPFITPSDIPATQKHVLVERHLSERGSHAHIRIQLPKKSVCVVCIGATIGKVCMADKASFSNQQINSIIPIKGKYDADFVYYISTTLRNALVSFAGGAATPIVNKSTFSSIKLLVPEYVEQQKIAAILSAYDELIENNQRRIALLETMAEEIYREWFVRLRFPGHEKVKVVKGAPEGWSVIEISDLVDFLSGFSFKSDSYTELGRYGIVTIKNVQEGVFINKCTDFFEEAPSRMKPHCHLQDGDILMSLTGNVGRVCQVFGEKLLLNQRVAKLKPKLQHSSQFVYFTFNNKSMIQLVENLSLGSTAQMNLSPILLGKQEMIVPSQELIKKFEDATLPMFTKKLSLLKQNLLLSHIRDMLLPRLISGKLSVENLDIHFPPSMLDVVVLSST